MRLFGRTKTGQEVHAIDLRAGSLRATVLSYGAILQDVRLGGIDRSLTLGFPDLAAYEGNRHYHGALVGPVANRIGGAAAQVGGVACRFEVNEGQDTTLHSGPSGVHAKVWEVVRAETDRVELRLTLPDGEGGFPGAREVHARFELRPPATLRLEVTVTTDAETLVNIANHSYWNLAGTPTWEGHLLEIAADHIVEVDDRNIPTGRLAPVEEGGFDFRVARAPMRGAPPIDHSFCLSDARVPLRPVARLSGGGVSLELATTEPGLQVFDGRPTYQGLAIEAQGWPDAPNRPAFPSVLLRPGETYRQETEWRFTG